MNEHPGTPDARVAPTRPMLRMDAVSQLVVEAHGVGFDAGARAATAEANAAWSNRLREVREDHAEQLAKSAPAHQPIVGYLSWNTAGAGLWFSQDRPDPSAVVNWDASDYRPAFVLLATIHRDGNVIWTQDASRLSVDAPTPEATFRLTVGIDPEYGLEAGSWVLEGSAEMNAWLTDRQPGEYVASVTVEPVRSLGGDAPAASPSVPGDAVTTGPPPAGWAETNGTQP
jgi:hypothetical protein